MKFLVDAQLPARLARHLVTNDTLFQLFDQHLGTIVAALQEAHFIELGLDSLVIQDAR